MKFDRYLHARVDKVLAEQFARAKRIVEDHRKEVDQIAEAVLANGTLSAAEVRDLFEQQTQLKLVEGVGRRTA